MNIDGVFLHHLISEIKSEIIGLRINKLFVINSYEFAFLLQNRKHLYVSLNSNSPHIRIASEEIIKSSKSNPFFTLLKKYSESSIIENIEQVENDRIAIFSLITFDELGYSKKIKLSFELFGRNSNAIILDENNIVIDCYKRLLPNDNDLRILIPKIEYSITKDEKINPFKENGDLNYNSFQGVSNLCFNEMQFQKTKDIIFLPTKAVLIKANNKYFFYCFLLSHLGGEIQEFSNLSELLYYYFYELKKDSHYNEEQNQIHNFLIKNLKRSQLKLEKQYIEKNEAINGLDYEKIGNILSSNLHLIKKNDSKITTYDYYNNKEITISLNPLLSPSANMNNYYNKYKKAKRTLEIIDEQIENSKKEINYFNCLLEQIEIAKAIDLAEIFEELNLKKKKAIKKKKTVPNFLVYSDDVNFIYVGKNNLQNNYLTHTFAKSNDIFFHVQGYSGSHTILRTNELTTELIKAAATLATLNSKSKNSSNVAVDYTLIRYVKKVPGTFGSFVTYTNQKTVFVTPDNDILKIFKRIK